MPEITDDMIRAARKHDHDTRPRGNWGSVPEPQVRRLLEGAFDARDAEQPLPTPGAGPSMHDLVIEDIRDRWASATIDRTPVAPAIAAVTASLRDRKQLGLERYGSTLQAHNGRDALRDLREEIEDAVVYCRQVIEEGRLDRGQSARFAIMYDGLIAMLFRVRETHAELDAR